MTTRATLKGNVGNQPMNARVSTFSAMPWTLTSPGKDVPSQSRLAHTTWPRAKWIGLKLGMDRLCATRDFSDGSGANSKTMWTTQKVGTSLADSGLPRTLDMIRADVRKAAGATQPGHRVVIAVGDVRLGDKFKKNKFARDIIAGLRSANTKVVTVGEWKTTLVCNKCKRRDRLSFVDGKPEMRRCANCGIDVDRRVNAAANLAAAAKAIRTANGTRPLYLRCTVCRGEMCEHRQ
jgi:hypothetical protein